MNDEFWSNAKDIDIKRWTMSAPHKLVTVTVTRYRLNRRQKWQAKPREYIPGNASIQRVIRLILE